MKKNIKSKIYKWHRWLGLTSLVPIIFWTMSGLTHPLMSNWLRPSIPVESYVKLSQKQMAPALSINQVLDQNHITALRNFGLVNFNQQTYYQVMGRDSLYRYYSAGTGLVLARGDSLYAIHLARYFLQDSLSFIKQVTLQTSFDGQYQPVNHLLPVWKVSFDRPDGMIVYVETGQNRLATFNNNTRKVLLWVFEQFHNWQFLAALGGENLRLIVLLGIVTIMLFALMSGLVVYGLFWYRFQEIRQKQITNKQVEKRITHRYHRQIGISVSVLMLTFFISAGFHLAVKLRQPNPPEKPYQQLIRRGELIVSNLKLPMADSSIYQTALVRIYGKVFYQISAPKKALLYYNAENGSLLDHADQLYAVYLAGYYRGNLKAGKKPDSTTMIKQFDHEYGFINKRLPVEKVSYAGADNWYIETTTAQLATHVAGVDRAEGLSFIFLHKFFWMTWAGKNIRDVVSMLAAAGILLTAILGFVSFIKNK